MYCHIELCHVSHKKIQHSMLNINMEVFKTNFVRQIRLSAAWIVNNLCFTQANKCIFPHSRLAVLRFNNCPTRCNNIQFISICKPLYTLRVVSPPIIRSSYHCIYSNWHYWDCYCYLSWTWLDGNSFPSSHVHHLVTSTTCSSNGLNNARYCRYSDMSSWWWVVIPPVTCRAVCR